MNKLDDWTSYFCVGHTPLSWIMRVQIALDAARGLEYIHEHTKPHYVHRDIKTSNILLDDSFRAKVCSGARVCLFGCQFRTQKHLIAFALQTDFRFWFVKTYGDNE